MDSLGNTLTDPPVANHSIFNRRPIVNALESLSRKVHGSNIYVGNVEGEPQRIYIDVGDFQDTLLWRFELDFHNPLAPVPVITEARPSDLHSLAEPLHEIVEWGRESTRDNSNFENLETLNDLIQEYELACTRARRKEVSYKDVMELFQNALEQLDVCRRPRAR